MGIELKDENIHSIDVLIKCRRNSSYHLETICLPYVTKKDGTNFYFEHNGCDNMDGSKECYECKAATVSYLLRHPDTDLRKPFLPVFPAEEN